MIKRATHRLVLEHTDAAVEHRFRKQVHGGNEVLARGARADGLLEEWPPVVLMVVLAAEGTGSFRVTSSGSCGECACNEVSQNIK